MVDTPISGGAQITSIAGTERLPASVGPFTPGTKGYLEPSTIRAWLIGQANTWTATQTIDPADNTSALVVSGFSLTGSNAQSLIDLAGTWNTSGTPVAVKVNMTDTASNAASRLIDLQLGGSTRFAVRKTGVVQIFSSTANQDITFDPTGNVTCVFTKNFNAHCGVASDAALGFNPAFCTSSAQPYAWRNGATITSGASDTFLYRDAAASSLAMRAGNVDQAFGLYGRYTSGTNFLRHRFRTASTLLSAVSGASVTATGLVPAGCLPISVTTRIDTTLGTGGGTTGYTVGDVADPDRYGALVATTEGSGTGNAQFTAAPVATFGAAGNIVITATGGNFNGIGAIAVSVAFLQGDMD